QGGDNMIDQEMLTAIGQIMDTKLEKALQPIKNDIAELRSGQEELRSGQEELKRGQEELRNHVRILKHDVKEIGWKVDTLYDWVDGIDLKVKKIEDRTTA
ncbi:MAG TPA: hypothetical protein VHP54_04440, partial [Caproiciproducens sp.]|nr:hypothetical protein [Caproiciproducens sp.]